MASEIYFVIPGNPEALTGGYLYDKRLIAALGRFMLVQRLIWPGDYPSPANRDRLYAAASLAAVPEGSLVLIDGLAFGALPELMKLQASRLRLVALVHHPLGYETGLPPALQQEMIATERQALFYARHIIVTSHRTARTLREDFSVAPSRLTVARPGFDPLPVALKPEFPNSPPLLLAIGAVIPRKGYDILAASLAALRELPWRCIIVGALDRDHQATSALRAQLAESSIDTRVRLAGEVADVQPFYTEADLFVLASHYEGYGMVYAEALQNGLPVVGTTGGAIPEVVPPGAGLLVPPGDVAALTAALRALLTDADLRQRLAVGARRAAATHPKWQETARIVFETLR